MGDLSVLIVEVEFMQVCFCSQLELNVWEPCSSSMTEETDPFHMRLVTSYYLGFDLLLASSFAVVPAKIGIYNSSIFYVL